MTKMNHHIVVLVATIVKGKENYLQEVKLHFTERRWRLEIPKVEKLEKETRESSMTPTPLRVKEYINI